MHSCKNVVNDPNNITWTIRQGVTLTHAFYSVKEAVLPRFKSSGGFRPRSESTIYKDGNVCHTYIDKRRVSQFWIKNYFTSLSSLGRSPQQHTCSQIKEPQFVDLKKGSNLKFSIRSESVTISRDSSNEQNAFVWFQRLRLTQTQAGCLIPGVGS